MTTQTITNTIPLSVTAALQNLLQKSYELYQATHYYHWNVEGARFVTLHELFEAHYTDIFAAIDEIAERIRILDAYVSPIQSDIRLDIVTGEGLADDRATRMVQHLITLHESVIIAASQAKVAAQEAEDNESEDLIIGRITTHQKALWMLRSLIK